MVHAGVQLVEGRRLPIFAWSTNVGRFRLTFGVFGVEGTCKVPARFLHPFEAKCWYR